MKAWGVPLVSSLASVAEPGPPRPWGSHLDLPPCVFSVSVGSAPGWTATGASVALLTCPVLNCREPFRCRPTLSLGGFGVQRATAAAHEGPADPPGTGPRGLPEPVSPGRIKFASEGILFTTSLVNSGLEEKGWSSRPLLLSCCEPCVKLSPGGTTT